jgi:hypothetical protein
MGGRQHNKKLKQDDSDSDNEEEINEVSQSP